MENFKEWLEKELKERNWSQRELARQASNNASSPLISSVLSGKKSITHDFCVAIAEPLGYDPVEVLRIAGLLPEEDPISERIKEIMRDLPEGKKIELLEYIERLAAKEKEPVRT